MNFPVGVCHYLKMCSIKSTCFKKFNIVNKGKKIIYFYDCSRITARVDYAERTNRAEESILNLLESKILERGIIQP